jgi:hypothetical protein
MARRYNIKLPKILQQFLIVSTTGKKIKTQQMTIKWNIKLDTENLTGGLVVRHQLPTRCFNWFEFSKPDIIKLK